jgi:hypothetical protein
MFGRISRSALIAASVAVMALAGTQPVLGATDLGHTGTVGLHSLTDTSSNPAAIGKYKYNSSDGFGWLVRFWVNPPNMHAVTGKSNQTVGWRFIVERKICGLGGCGNWTTTYTSPEQTAETDDSHDAPFTQLSVGVTVPCGHNCSDAGATYRITEKLIWHKANGAIQGTDRERIYYYAAHMTNGQSGVMTKVAWDAWSPDF